MKFIIRKTGMLLLIFLGITFLSFGLTFLSPSDPAEIKLSRRGVMPTEELLEQTREEMGLNRPLPVRYGDWVLHMLQGDMGVSIKSGKPVVEELKKALPNTIQITVCATIVVMLLSIPLGILCARYKDSFFDYAVRILTYMLASLPSFFLALICLYIFSVKLGWFQVITSKDANGYVMPVMVLSIGLSAWYIRQVRTVVLEEMSKDYITGSRARGVPESRIFFSHILKNAILPILTLLGISFANMLAGTTIVENIFSSKGLGNLAMEAITARDYPVIQGYVLWMAIIFLLVNFAVDLSYGLVDPRIRHGQKEI